MGWLIYTLMKVLVTGANGLLGQHLVKLLLEKNHCVIATGKGPSRLLFAESALYQYHDIDITNKTALFEFAAGEKPDTFIHTAAMTQVDACELNREGCFAVNVSGTKHVMHVAEMHSRFFIHVSTDFVFNGEKGNYKEEDEMSPVNYYGATKLQAERLVYDCKIPWAIVRTCLVYGLSPDGTRSNIISWVKGKLEKKEKIKVVDDQIRTPTYVEDLAKGIILVMEKKAEGIFHISGKDILTPYAMALQTADFFSLDKNLIEKVTAETFSQTAKRPQKTGFIIDKARKELGYEPMSFQEGLKKMYH